jgi:ribosomal-protein-alanine N-acetyltransferase
MLSLQLDPFPVLLTQRLVLRAITTADVNEVLELRSDKAVMAYIDRPLAQSAADAMELIQKIMDGIKIDQPNYRAEIGYLLHPMQQRKGLMQEAIAAALVYGFSTMGLHSVEANINPANEASKKILLNNNFVQEAYFKENYFSNGRFLDSAVYSLLAPSA